MPHAVACFSRFGDSSQAILEGPLAHDVPVGPCLASLCQRAELVADVEAFHTTALIRLLEWSHFLNMTNFIMLKRFEIIASRALLFMETLMFNSIGASPSEHKVIAGAVLFLRFAKHKGLALDLVKQDQALEQVHLWSCEKHGKETQKVLCPHC